jgi:histidine triad (HIT) family protein
MRRHSPNPLQARPLVCLRSPRPVPVTHPEATDSQQPAEPLHQRGGAARVRSSDTVYVRSPQSPAHVKICIVPDCLFCGIAAGEIPARIILETDRTVAFHDVNPQAPVHVLVIPRAHHANLAELTAASDGLLTEVVEQAHQVATSTGVADTGYRVVFNTGQEGGQTVHHVHAHVLGGRAMTWPPG